MDYKFTSKKYSDRLSNIISIYSGSYMLHPLIQGAVQINLTTSTTDGTDRQLWLLSNSDRYVDYVAFVCIGI